jgi:hypothetical protein
MDRLSLLSTTLTSGWTIPLRYFIGMVDLLTRSQIKEVEQQIKRTQQQYSVIVIYSPGKITVTSTRQPRY